MSRISAPWLHSRWVDGGLILAPAFLATAFAVLAPGLFGEGGKVSPLAWLVLVVGVDVAHVYASLYRTYFKLSVLSERPALYTLVPVFCLVGGLILFSLGDLWFWRGLAYLAVFHFVRQQYGFFALYARRDAGGPLGFIDKAAIYLATLGPLAYWHARLPRDFHWFVDGDFFTLGSTAAWLDGLVAAAYAIVAVAYMVQEARRATFNLPKNLLLLGTALSWGVGIVLYDSDIVFTVTNVVAHGIPYLALVWITGRAEAKDAALFKPAAIPMFVGVLLLFAYVEEGFWDALVWRDHESLFGAFAWLSEAGKEFHLGWVVPLLALPQATHYVLDGFIWRIKAPAAVEASALFAEPMERAG